MITRTRLATLAVVLALVTLTLTLRAQVPQLINYQGRVAVGTVNFDGTGQFKFALVNANGSTTYWSNDGTSTAGSEPTTAVTLTVTKGLYSVLLGDVTMTNMTIVPALVFANANVHLRVWFNDGANGSQRLTPDPRLAPTGYLPDSSVSSAAIANGAVTATKFGSDVGQWSVNGANVFRNSGNVGINKSNPATALDVNGTVTATGFSGSGAGLLNLNAANLTGTISDAQLAGSFSGLLTMNNAGNTFSGSGTGLTALNASNLGSGTLADARLSGNIALLNAAQAFTAGKTFSTAPSFTAAGAPFLVTSTTMVANLNADRLDGLEASAFLQANSGVPLTLTGTSATSIVGATNSSAAPGASAVSGSSTAISGNTLGGRFENASGSGVGVIGVATAGAGFNTGVWGRTDSPDGRGVYGAVTAITGVNSGVVGNSGSPDGRGVYGAATAGDGVNSGVYGHSNSISGRGVYGFAGATSGANHGGKFEAASTGGTGVFGNSTSTTGSTIGVFGQTASSTGRGVVGLASSTGSGNTYGVHGLTLASNGVGVVGQATAAFGATYGLYGVSDSPSGRGVFGFGSAVTGVTTGVFGHVVSSSDNAVGVFGRATASTGFTFAGRFECASQSGIGVFAWATPGIGLTTGAYGRSDSNSGNGVFGIAVAPAGITYGGRFESVSPSGIGVLGFATATSGVSYGVYGQSAAPNGKGVYGIATASTGSTTGAGVYGTVGVNPSGWGVFSNGDIGSSGVKRFSIDHPDDPGGKYLYHYSAESAEVINFYRGTVVLDGAGGAVVDLPHYFAKINKTPGYTLTAVGAPMPMLHVAEEIDEAALIAGAKAEPGEPASLCTFRIAGGAAGAKVSWRVEAVRNDRWVQKRGAPVEVEKQDVERGTYQHPDLYGQPPEKSVNYDAGRSSSLEATRPDPVTANPRETRVLSGSVSAATLDATPVPQAGADPESAVNN